MRYDELLKQYISTGLEISPYQFDKIKDNTGLLKTYFYNRNKVLRYDSLERFSKKEIEFLEKNPKYLSMISTPNLFNIFRKTKNKSYFFNFLMERNNNEFTYLTEMLQVLLVQTPDVNIIIKKFGYDKVCNAMGWLSYIGYVMPHVKDLDAFIDLFLKCGHIVIGNIEAIFPYVKDEKEFLTKIIENKEKNLEYGVASFIIGNDPKYYSEVILNKYGNKINNENMGLVIKNSANPIDLADSLTDPNSGYKLIDHVYPILTSLRDVNGSYPDIIIDKIISSHKLDDCYVIGTLLMNSKDPISVAKKIGLETVYKCLKEFVIDSNDIDLTIEGSRNSPGMESLFKQAGLI